jgi:hypothetical protein
MPLRSAEPLFAKPLEAVRRAPRFERSAPQDLGARPPHGRGRRLDLRFAFRRARARHHDDFVAADAHVVDGDDRVLRLERPAGELVRLADAQNLLYAIHELDEAGVDVIAATDRADNGSIRAGRPMHVEAQFQKLVDDVLNLLVGRPLLHHHNHVASPQSFTHGESSSPRRFVHAFERVQVPL